jgi:phenylalanyl-tRNA synthetase beta chain
MNLVLLEQGQPLHAFDLRDIQGGEIVVRRARAGERMRTLDGVERALVEDDVVIADGRRPVALAGVMGGQDGEVRADTTAILLEAATFDPVRIRRTASRLGLRTEASSRFEKALDPVQAEAAARRFLELLLAHVPQARVTRRLADAYPRPYPPIRIALSYDVLRRRLGTRISDAGIRAHLASIGFEPKEEGGILHVQVPSWRATKDVSSAEDLYEEVGRLAGYEALPTTAPVGPLRPTRLPPLRRLERRLGLSLSLDRGYTEILSYAFYGARDAARVGLADTPHLGVLDSTSAEHDRLILTTAPNLLRAAARNQPRVASGRLWEITRLHAPRADGRGLPREARVLGLVAWERGGGEDAEGRLYLEVLEDLRHVLAAVPVTPLEVREAGPEPLVAGLPETSWLHPGRRAALVVGGRVLAVAGEVLPRVARAFDLEGRAVLAEATLEGILAVLGEPGAGYRPVHRFPVVPFDVAVVVPERTPAADVAAAIEGAVPDHVRGVRVFDVYAGEGIPTGARSLALTMELLDAEGTLKPEQADDLRARILAALVARGWTVRKGDESA